MTRGTWTRRIALTAAATAAVTAMAVPAGAQAAPATGIPTVATASVTAAAAAANVDYATWQADVRAVMDQARPYLEQRIATTKPGEKKAIVFDIDNTTLETDFGFSYPQPANKPVLDIAKYAQDRGVALFFVTARPDILSWVTDYNLKAVGYQVTGLRVRGFLDLFKDVAAYKTAQRVDIENKGYTIIANIGNSATDLSGGHAEKTYKLPDYDGQLS
ncbi:HAD family acid phosphatase [Streptomyces sp. Amel2xC10]|uniref:HAD family acid phosphatase n=1 Tax=Streptomyces sp. Amel2xC10 TaxID=1305826 RepID=UPI000A086E13|nr:HAD family acid phosphatase [Streptomyces sp. Amel2xC10]SMF85317.1 Predicted hydrolases of the HAD superfamily [Streptomyces sp. Amel2xC10]